jgi:6-phosphofructokinase 2
MRIVTVTMNPSVDVEASVDTLTPVHKMRCSGARREPGGGGINVARVVRRLGGDCTALYTAGGCLGQLLRQLVAAEDIPDIAVPIAGETRESFTVRQTSDDAQYRFVLPGPALAEREWQACLARIEALPAPPAFLVASGSMPPGVPDDFFARLARCARKLGARFVVDTSGPALQAALAEGVYLVKPNLRELGQAVEAPVSDAAAWESAALALVRSGKAELVALTLGEEGAFLAARDFGLRAPSVPVKPASAVGAGDSFLAGMLWRLAAGGRIEDAFRYGIAAGAAALLTPGTELARKDDIERLHEQVRVTTAPAAA